MVSFALEIWTSITCNLKSGFQILPKKMNFNTEKKSIHISCISSLPFGKLTLRRQSLVLSSWARNQKKGSSSKMEGTEEKMIG